MQIRTTMTVRDTSGTCEMTLFDSQLSKLCNRSIIWLNSRAQSCADPYDVPAEVNGVLNQSFVWIAKKKVTLMSQRTTVYTHTVVDATDDLEVTKKITTKLSKKGDPIDLDNDSDEYNTPRTFKVKNNVMHDGTLSTSGSSKHREKANSGKRKSDYADVIGDDTPTSKASTGVGALKIPKMERL
ncbi:uncharacterized protein [Rutidosis leptorrhynchoides]|uniref:uncharacterized protein isoform X2 n=1 Tax=Rutidosis leptorrhynchoides TaxID=125765 RepID=UPI003A99D7B7